MDCIGLYSHYPFLLTLGEPFEFALILLIWFSLMMTILGFPDAITFYSVVTFKSYLLLCLFFSQLHFFVPFHLRTLPFHDSLLLASSFRFFLLHQINVEHGILMFCIGSNFSNMLLFQIFFLFQYFCLFILKISIYIF